VVTTWQKDTRERTRSPAPAPGGEPARPPLDPEPIPGVPPLRDGVPVGYKPGNRFRFEVLRREAVRYPDDEPGTPPEEFWVVRVRTLEGAPARVADLFYAVADLTLARVVLDPEGKPRAHVQRGTALLGVPASLELGCPLDWPDLRAAAEERAELPIPGGPKLEQRVRRTGEGQAEARQVRLAALDEQGQAQGAKASFLWRPGEPFWSRLASGELLGRLDEFGPR
jgi:PAS domain-containing protein